MLSNDGRTLNSELWKWHRLDLKPEWRVLNASLLTFLPVLLHFWTIICSKHVSVGLHLRQRPPSVAKWKNSERGEKQLWLAVRFSQQKQHNKKSPTFRRHRKTETKNPTILICPGGYNTFTWLCPFTDVPIYYLCGINGTALLHSHLANWQTLFSQILRWCHRHLQFFSSHCSGLDLCCV